MGSPISGTTILPAPTGTIRTLTTCGPSIPSAPRTANWSLSRTAIGNEHELHQHKRIGSATPPRAMGGEVLAVDDAALPVRCGCAEGRCVADGSRVEGIVQRRGFPSWQGAVGVYAFGIDDGHSDHQFSGGDGAAARERVYEGEYSDCGEPAIT